MLGSPGDGVNTIRFFRLKTSLKIAHVPAKRVIMACMSSLTTSGSLVSRNSGTRVWKDFNYALRCWCGNSKTLFDDLR